MFRLEWKPGPWTRGPFAAYGGLVGHAGEDLGEGTHPEISNGFRAERTR